MGLIYAAAAAKSLQSCPMLCNPRDSSPEGSSVPGILQARTLEWAAISIPLCIKWASLVAQMVKRLPAMRETQDPSLGWEDPLEKEMASYTSTLAWKIPWTKEPGKLQSMVSQRVKTGLSDFTLYIK